MLLILISLNPADTAQVVVSGEAFYLQPAARARLVIALDGVKEEGAVRKALRGLADYLEPIYYGPSPEGPYAGDADESENYYLVAEVPMGKFPKALKALEKAELGVEEVAFESRRDPELERRKVAEAKRVALERAEALGLDLSRWEVTYMDVRLSPSWVQSGAMPAPLERVVVEVLVTLVRKR